jgi:hypothetical protein
MTSCTATAPIDIPTTSSVNPIKGKFNVMYSPDMCSGTSLTISSDRNYLSLSCKSSGSAVSFYGAKYLPSEIRIYSPSLHTYNGSNADAEILIIHTPGSSDSSSGLGSPANGLIVSVPVSFSSSSSNNVDLAAIIQASNTINVNTISINPSVAMNYDVNANNFIPNKPFYVYYGTLPYDSCSGNYYYAVFTDSVSASGPLSALVASNISSVQQSIRTNLQKSNAGPFSDEDSGYSDYVMFQLVGDDCDDEDAGVGLDKPAIESKKSSIGMNILWGIIIAFVLLGISYMFLNKDDVNPSKGGGYTQGGNVGVTDVNS